MILGLVDVEFHQYSVHLPVALLLVTFVVTVYV